MDPWERLSPGLLPPERSSKLRHWIRRWNRRWNRRSIPNCGNDRTNLLKSRPTIPSLLTSRANGVGASRGRLDLNCRRCFPSHHWSPNIHPSSRRWNPSRRKILRSSRATIPLAHRPSTKRLGPAQRPQQRGETMNEPSALSPCTNWTYRDPRNGNGSKIPPKNIATLACNSSSLGKHLRISDQGCLANL